MLSGGAAGAWCSACRNRMPPGAGQPVPRCPWPRWLTCHTPQGAVRIRWPSRSRAAAPATGELHRTKIPAASSRSQFWQPGARTPCGGLRQVGIQPGSGLRSSQARRPPWWPGHNGHEQHLHRRPPQKLPRRTQRRCLAAAPLQWFDQWLQEPSARSPDNAMTVATVGCCDLRPSPAGCSSKGMTGAASSGSPTTQGPPTGRQPLAALQFHWVELDAWCASEGTVEKVSDARERRILCQPSARLTHRRLGQPAKPGDFGPGRAGGQCSQIRRAVHAQASPPTHWGGYRLQPEQWEFWQGAKAACTTGCATGAMEPNGYVRRLAP